MTKGGAFRRINANDNLPIGTRVFGFLGYAGSESGVFAVYKNDRERRSYELVEIGGRRRFATTDYFIRPESEKFGIGYYWDDSKGASLYTREELEDAIRGAKEQEEQERREAEEAARKRAELREQLIAQYEGILEMITPENRYGRNNPTGRNIRTLLKRTFPATKFSVKKGSSDSYHISWTDGPSNAKVEAIVNQFQDSHADISGDYWDYDPSLFNELFGGVSFIFTDHEISPEIIAAACEKVGISPEDYRMGRADWSLSWQVNEILEPKEIN